MKKEFTKAQTTELKRLAEKMNIAKQAVDDFIGYLAKEYLVKEGWSITQTLDAFEKADVLPKEQIEQAKKPKAKS